MWSTALSAQHTFLLNDIMVSYRPFAPTPVNFMDFWDTTNDKYKQSFSQDVSQILVPTDFAQHSMQNFSVMVAVPPAYLGVGGEMRISVGVGAVQDMYGVANVLHEHLGTSIYINVNLVASVFASALYQFR